MYHNFIVLSWPSRLLLLLISFLYSTHSIAQQLPSTSDFMNVLTLCGAGSTYKLNSDLQRDAASIYERGKTEGQALQEIVAAIIDKLPADQRAVAYKDYLNCITDIIRPRQTQILIDGGTIQEGNLFELDLGVLPIDEKYELSLIIVPPKPIQAAKLTSSSEVLRVQWENGKDQTPIDIGYNRFRITIENHTLKNTSQENQIMLIGNQKPLARIIVKYVLSTTSVEVSEKSGPKMSGRGQDFSAPFRVCAKAPSPNYKVDNFRSWLTGDRGCNA